MYIWKFQTMQQLSSNQSVFFCQKTKQIMHIDD